MNKKNSYLYATKGVPFVRRNLTIPLSLENTPSRRYIPTLSYPIEERTWYILIFDVAFFSNCIYERNHWTVSFTFSNSGVRFSTNRKSFKHFRRWGDRMNLCRKVFVLSFSQLLELKPHPETVCYRCNLSLYMRSDLLFWITFYLSKFCGCSVVSKCVVNFSSFL